MIDIELTEPEKQILSYVEGKNVNLFFGASYITVSSSVGLWRIYLKSYDDLDNCVDYFVHQNHRSMMSKRNHNKLNCGFHKHSLDSKSIYEVLNYIIKHDKSFVRRSKKKNYNIFSNKIM